MCGITAFFSLLPRDEAQKIVNKVLDSYVYRGLDGKEILTKEFTIQEKKFNLNFVHLPLNIIDLTETRNQPMFDSTGRNVIIYNGELYNYVELKEELLNKGVSFKSTSYTEILLELFVLKKKKILSKLIGMFSFLIFYLQENQLFFARDHVGIKTLYYSKNETGILFMPEPKAAVISGFQKFEPNDSLIFDFLSYGISDHASETIFEGLKQIP